MHFRHWIVFSGILSIAVLQNPCCGLDCIDYGLEQGASIGQLTLPPFVENLTVQGSFLYSANVLNGVRVVDVSDPSNMTLVGFAAADNSALAVLVDNDVLFVSTGDGALLVYTLEVPSNPSLIGDWYPGSGDCYDLLKVDSTVYISAFVQGVRIVNVSDPMNPSPLGEIDTPGDAMYLAYAAGFLLVADYSQGVQIIDVANPQDASIVANIDTPGHAINVCTFEHYAYIADQEHGVLVVDISDPTLPETLDFVPPLADCLRVSVVDEYLYATTSSGLFVFDLSNAGTPQLVGHQLGSTFGSVCSNEDYLFVQIFGSFESGVCSMRKHCSFTPQQLRITRQASNVRLDWIGIDGAQWKVYRSANPLVDDYSPIAICNTTSFIDSSAIQNHMYFYRVVTIY